MPPRKLGRIGRRDRWVKLLALTEDIDPDYGDAAPQSDHIAGTWASKKDLSGRELEAAQRINPEIATRWDMAFREEAYDSQALKYGGRLYPVKHILEIGSRDGMAVFTASRMRKTG